MIRQLFSRIIQLVITVFGVFTLLFFLLRVTGDPVATLLGPNASTEQIAVLTGQLGLDKPLWEQYLMALWNMLILDFGVSLRSGQSAMVEAGGRLLVSLQLVGSALLVAMLAAIPIGVLASSNRHPLRNRLLVGGTYVLQATPVYVSGILFIILLAQTAGLFPTFGWSSPLHWVLPVLTLSLVAMAKFARLTRSSMVEALREDYVRTARAKGLSPTRVQVAHALRNSLIPVITVFGAELGAMIGSAVITESLFSVPGIGQMLVTAALARDYALVQAGAFLIAVVVVLINIVVDVAYPYLDPRVRDEKSSTR